MDNKPKYNALIHHRRSIRLQGYDYSQSGLYFITICCHEKTCMFGNIINNAMLENDAGKIANECWKKIPEHFPNVILHKYVIMPNHVHGILEIAQNNYPNVGAENFLPLQQHKFQKPIPRSISSIIKGYKIGVTKWMRANTNIDIVWQRNYYEHIIRHEQSYQNISEYITNNPANWALDKFYQ